MLAVQGHLVVANIGPCPPHVYKTNMLSNRYSCSRTNNRCCSANEPNQDDLEKVIVVEFQVLSHNMEELLHIHPFYHTKY